jgi:Zn-dependent protease
LNNNFNNKIFRHNTQLTPIKQANNRILLELRLLFAAGEHYNNQTFNFLGAVMDQSALGLGLAWYLVFVFSLVFHEAAHALAAWRLGDSTAYIGGQVTLNPAPHIRREPFGMVVFPIISFLLGGWMFGWASAPYDPTWALSNPRKSAIMALAGPVANLILCLLAGILIRVGLAYNLFEPGINSLSQIVISNAEGWTRVMAIVLSITFTLNLILFFFNLFPLPPFDGSSIIQLFLTPAGMYRYAEMIHRPAYMIMGLIIVWNTFDFIFPSIFTHAMSWLFAGISLESLPIPVEMENANGLD